MTGYHNLLVALLVTLSIICFYDIYLTKAHNGGNSGGNNVELIHIDSPNSTLYNPNETPFQRLTNSFNRSFILLTISTHMGLADTVSNMIWLQCQYCFSCCKQYFPIFNPTKSTTYENVSCSSDACGSIPNRYCTVNVCQYRMKYVSGAISAGDVARETFSLVRAYESNHVSKLNFGGHAIVSDPRTVSTPLKYGPKGRGKRIDLEVEADLANDQVCLAIVPSPNFFIYGNLAMRNFLIGISVQINSTCEKKI
ncbi:hypothetical protein Lal_00012509 [Lupinus albus]|nr:hypothetical protein Lal_00012509 [Lupinus albus]